MGNGVDGRSLLTAAQHGFLCWHVDPRSQVKAACDLHYGYILRCSVSPTKPDHGSDQSSGRSTTDERRGPNGPNRLATNTPHYPSKTKSDTSERTRNGKWRPRHPETTIGSGHLKQ